MSTKNTASVLISIQTLASLYPLTAHGEGVTLPFATIGDFEAFGAGTRDISKASVIAFTPLLKTEDDLVAWNAYSANHSDWIVHGREFNHDSLHAGIHDVIDQEVEDHQGHNRDRVLLEEEMDHKDENENHEDEDHDENESDEISEYVYSFDSTGRKVPEDGSGPFAPIWQMTPVPDDTSIVNFNLESDKMFRDLLNHTLTTDNPILSEPVRPQDFFGTAFGGSESPFSILLQPVFDAFEHEKIPVIIGAVVALLPWKDFFDDVSIKPGRLE